MYRVVWTTVPNLKRKEFVDLADAVHSAIFAQLPAKVYEKRKVIAQVDKDGIRYL